jgi:hypothetical protein
MTETTEIEAPAASITIQEIVFLLQIVETCSQRGAFRAEELSSVGAVYDKVRGFLAANTPPPETPPEEGTE